MGKTALVIVESPTKAKTIKKFLPKDYIVEASMGHIRDLPESATEIPEALKKEKWARLGVNVEKDFEPLYIIPKGKSKVVSELRKKLKEVDELYLATDEDREGESISWHLFEILKPKVPVKRMVFHEITRPAIQKAIQEPRQIDLRLVQAQEARRILDRLYGYTLSPLLWSKICYGLSAGRVQSVGLRLIVDRERERLAFVKADYWDIQAELAKKTGSDFFSAKLSYVGQQRIANGKDFDETTGKLSSQNALWIQEDQARKLSDQLKNATWKVMSVEEKPLTSRPAPPFITSTLQQEANRKLGWSSRDAMRVAQRLYEEGLITYMRTDSPNLSQEAIQAARSCVKDLYGSEYLSPEPRQYSSKAKGAQEAHEAIRPAGSEFVLPRDSGLTGKELALYEMIWMRAVATQMAEAKKLSVVVKISAGDCTFSASGTRILFPGFIRAYVEGSDDPEAALEDKEVLLPALQEGDELKPQKIEPISHETKPPARYTEASLVQKLEKEGIGRPSTYASIIDTLVDRDYVRRISNSLVPSFTGFAVTQLLEKHFESLVDPQFTSKMEESLDEIAEGKLESKPYLRQFYLGNDGLSTQVKSREKKIDADESRSIHFPHLKDLDVRIGRYGAYVVKDDLHASLPESLAPADLSRENVDEIIEIQRKGPQSLGTDPKSGLPVYCLTGRYGPYFQLGDATEQDPKPKRVSLLKGMDPKSVTLDEALQALSLPRELGTHPQTGKPIKANVGRFGPYIVHEKDFRSLKKDDNLFTITLDRALQLLSEEKKGRRGPTALREIGPHPEDQQTIAVYQGPYGLYVKHGKLNATIPEGTDPQQLTLEAAVKLLAERAASGKTKRIRGAGAARKRKK